MICEHCGQPYLIGKLRPPVDHWDELRQESLQRICPPCYDEFFVMYGPRVRYEADLAMVEKILAEHPDGPFRAMALTWKRGLEEKGVAAVFDAELKEQVVQEFAVSFFKDLLKGKP